MGALAGGLGCFPLDDGSSHPPSHSRCARAAFAVCRRLVSGEAPARQQRSTSARPFPAAVPQYISGRTSYLRVRLAFHPYPQLIRAFCNRHRCGPPRPVRDASAWPWVAHTVSGQSPATVAHFRLAFTPAPAGAALTAPLRITRRIILQKARGHRLPGSHGVEAHDFRVSFTPLAGVLFTVPSRYCALSVTACSLPWTVVCPASARVLRARTYSGDGRHAERYAYATLTRFGAGFHTASASSGRVARGRQPPPDRSSNPVAATLGGLARPRFRLRPVRSPLLRASFTLPPATEMFQLAGFPLPGGSATRWWRVAPFGHLRITACTRLPGAYRRLAPSFFGTQRPGIHRVLILSSPPS